MATTGSLRARLWFGAGRVLLRARRPRRAPRGLHASRAALEP